MAGSALRCRCKAKNSYVAPLVAEAANGSTELCFQKSAS
ncbi:hypothetical protein SS05631_a45210 (plasmid) [Sinorhizobium sp. CCBAU 05631]|uniref:Uncharacterized protein n=1 Tax=Sinorhizobium fredii (strain USDA 257) TaxID=1185652 RepID=I3XGL7_SINF2|nr:hypothetical protein USDA257_p03080 [Sinorhizobium fredii USDA 257]ASY60904.1 hypothetical protein SS05631_a45210 [Sinorhizobium sp. CCBAU 05631]CCE98765.1 hypothetical protein SFHH103_04281 [Sinorhizobium fredii HH103]CEO91567.1 hypothetical protein SFHH103_psfHH103d_366 [Sinorhizobium fredii HH103]